MDAIPKDGYAKTIASPASDRLLLDGSDIRIGVDANTSIQEAHSCA